MPFAGATLIAVAAFAAFSGFLFLNTIYLQDVRGFSALRAGLYMLPIAAMTVVFAPLSGRLVGSSGARGSRCDRGGRVPRHRRSAAHRPDRRHTRRRLWSSRTWSSASASAMVNAPITNAAVSGMPRAQAGVAAAMASTSRQIGQSLGVAIIGSVVIAGIHGPYVSGFAPASHAGWWVIAAFGAAVFVLGIVTTGRRAKATAERTAERLTVAEPKVPATTS